MRSLRQFFGVRAVLSLLSLCWASYCYSATLYVKPSATGSGNGSDWTNALGGSFTPARGNTYYIASGTYPSKVWSTANSGTTQIVVKKATVADHGTATGWVDSLGTGQAVWGYWNVQTDYWVFDGQSRGQGSDWDGANTTYGFRVNGGGAGAIRIDNGGGTAGCDNSTFRYIDIVGGGRDTGKGDDAIYTLYGGANVTFQYCSLRDTDRTIFLLRDGPSGWVVEYCFLGRNASSAAVHGEMCSTTDGSNMVWRYNVIKDCEGTAIWAFINNGAATGWEFYGNLIFHSAVYAASGREGVAGTIYCANDASNNNSLSSAKFYNNTIYGIKGTYSGVHIESGTSNSVTNNIWVGCVTTGNAGIAGSYNYYASTSGGDSGTGTQTNASASIFVNAATENFRLSGTNLPNGGLSSLGATYATDMDGKTRGADGRWDRGAFEYGTTGSDVDAPIISSVQSTNITTATATITWSTNEAATTVVEYGQTTSYGANTSDATLVLSHTNTLSGLTAGTTYQYRVKSADAAGNLATSSNLTFTTSAPSDTTPPIISNVQSSGVGTTGATVSWSTNEASTTVVEYGLTTSYGATASGAGLVTSHSQALSGLTAGTIYHYRVKSADGAGNLATSADFTFTTQVSPDTTPPVISNIQASGISANNATIAWSTNEASTTVIEYGPTSSYGTTVTDATLVLNHTKGLSGLSPSTTYQYRVNSADAAGNTSSSANLSFTTASAPDATAPSVAITSPSDAQNVSGAITITAAASDNVGVAGVIFLVDDQPVGQEIANAPYTTSWNTLATADGQHVIKARARDAAGNLTTSVPVTVQISNGVDAGLVGYWKMDEGQGTQAMDSSGNNANGSLQTGAAWTTFGASNAINLDGVTGFVSVPEDPALRVTDKITIALWVKHSSLPASGQYMHYMEKGQNDHDNYGVGIGNSTQGLQLYFEFEDSTGVYRRYKHSTAIAIAANTWTHIAVTFDDAANVLKFYKNGAEVGSATVTQSLNSTLTAPVSVGRENFAGWEWYLKGAVSDLRVYKRLLSAAELTALYSQRLPAPPAGLRVVQQ